MTHDFLKYLSNKYIKSIYITDYYKYDYHQYLDKYIFYPFTVENRNWVINKQLNRMTMYVYLQYVINAAKVTIIFYERGRIYRRRRIGPADKRWLALVGNTYVGILGGRRGRKRERGERWWRRWAREGTLYPYIPVATYAAIASVAVAEINGLSSPGAGHSLGFCSLLALSRDTTRFKIINLADWASLHGARYFLPKL